MTTSFNEWLWLQYSSDDDNVITRVKNRHKDDINFPAEIKSRKELKEYLQTWEIRKAVHHVVACFAVTDCDDDTGQTIVHEAQDELSKFADSYNSCRFIASVCWNEYLKTTYPEED